MVAEMMPNPIPASVGQVHASLDGGVAWVILDNLPKRNAMSLAMWRELRAALLDLAQDPQVRCVVLRGAGDKAFCAGADVAEKQGLDAAQSEADTQIALEGLQAVREFPKPLIAMVSGYCIGAGVAIALGCDIRVAAEGASFGVPAARLGLAYYYIDLKRLSDAVGPARAKQMLFTADRIDAQRALQIGLVEEVTAPSELREAVAAMARRIAANAPLTIAAAKHAIVTAVSDPPGRDLARCEALASACLSSDDYEEGRRAFKEKREPRFQGR